MIRKPNNENVPKFISPTNGSIVKQRSSCEPARNSVISNNDEPVSPLFLFATESIPVIRAIVFNKRVGLLKISDNNHIGLGPKRTNVVWECLIRN